MARALTTIGVLLILLSVMLHRQQAIQETNKQPHHFCNSSGDGKRTAGIFVSALLENNYYGHDTTACPTEASWLQRMARDDLPGSQPKVFINVGFNKGFNFATWLNVFRPASKVSNVVWYAAMQKWTTKNRVNLHEPSCGVCDDCKEQVNANLTTIESNILLIGVDINEANINLVRGVFESLSSTKDHRLEGVSLRCIHAGGGAESAIIRIPKCPPGWEVCRIPDNATYLTDEEWTKAAGGAEAVKVPILTVDEIVRNMSHAGLHRPNTYNDSKPQGYVDILMIDTEGHDALVLKGAAHLIRRRAVRCIIFEYHGFSPWATMKLEDVVRDLDLHGYSCFFQGKERLWPLSGPCWSELYEFHNWSNVMCVEKTDIWMSSIQPFIIDGAYINTILRSGDSLEGRVIKVKPAASVTNVDWRLIYLVKNMTKYPFWSGDAFLARGFQFGDERVVSSEYAAFLADGDWIKK